jgi:hypothetical protein
MVSLQSTQPPRTLFPPSATVPSSPRIEQATELLLEFAAKTLADWGVREIGVVECWPEADRPVRQRISGLASTVRFYGLDEVIRTGFPAAAGQIWLSSRFHPHLIAAGAGAAGVAVSLMRGYYDTKHGSLIEQGSSWDLHHYRPSQQQPDIPARPTGKGFAPAELAGLRARKLRVAERIYGSPTTRTAVPTGENREG